MGMTSARVRLRLEHRNLMIAWDRSRESWRDGVSRAFEKRRLTPLDGQVRAACSVMEQIESLLEEARRDCGEEQR
jgi:hypothetical protein